MERQESPVKRLLPINHTQSLRLSEHDPEDELPQGKSEVSIPIPTPSHASSELPTITEGDNE